MADYFANLAARLNNRSDAIRPIVPARFEPEDSSPYSNPPPEEASTFETAPRPDIVTSADDLPEPPPRKSTLARQTEQPTESAAPEARPPGPAGPVGMKPKPTKSKPGEPSPASNAPESPTPPVSKSPTRHSRVSEHREEEISAAPAAERDAGSPIAAAVPNVAFDPGPRRLRATPATSREPRTPSPLQQPVERHQNRPGRLEVATGRASPATRPRREPAIAGRNSNAPPAIEITIGRIEVTAVLQESNRPARPAPAGPVLTLQDYLKQRSPAA